MTRRGRVSAALLVVMALVGAACSSSREASDTAASGTSASSDQTTSITTTAIESATTTSAPPPATTEAPPARDVTPGPAEPAAGAPPLPTDGPRPRAVLTAGGIVVPVLGREGDGLVVGTPCGKSATIGTGRPLEGAVVLDPGHGGDEPGAVGPNGLTERELNLAVARFAAEAIEATGVPVVLTRAGDYRVTLDARAAIVKALRPRAFVSIHHNAVPDGAHPRPGTETYFQTVGSSAAASKRLAGLVYEETVRALEGYPGVAWVGDTDAGAKYRKNGSGNDYYAMVRTSQGTPGILAELGFISNAPEADLYARADVQRAEGEAVARAVVRFLTTDDPGSGFVEPYPREAPAGPGGGASGCQDPALG